MVASPIAQSPPELKRPGTSDSEDSRTSVQSFSEIAGSERWDSAQSRKKSLGEMAFKSPIIGTQSRVELPKLDPHQVIGYRAQMTHDWGIYWYLPTLMVVAFLAGVIGTVGHHSFYASLHGHKSVNPLLMVRVGTAFAFFVKTCLTGAVVIAYK